ncbi:MAG: hypothetical protein DMF61_00895 [Blastocatellia bacterium AA13]|nr:MAG: hypothetical protein DMF61_00895 [Blastocatellia bacterium AA13]
MSKTRPLIIAHRGASGCAPENTLAAFQLAAPMGSDGVEMDVNLSADGRPVVIHDHRLNRTTNSAGLVSLLSAGELAALNAGGGFKARMSLKRKRTANAAAFSSFHRGVPSLDEVLALLARFTLSRIYVELKGTPLTRMPLLEATLQAIERSGLEKSITLLSFDHELMAEAAKIQPSIRTALTFHLVKGAIPATRAIAKAVDRARASEAALHHALATRRRIAALHKRGMAVSAWTANGRLTMKRLIESGVDCIMTNYPHRLRDLIESQPASDR